MTSIDMVGLLTIVATVPRRTIQHQEYGLWIAHQQDHQEVSGHVGSELRCRARDCATIAQVKRSVEMHTIAVWEDTDDGGLTDRRPDPCQCGWKVKAHLVQRQDHPLG